MEDTITFENIVYLRKGARLNEVITTRDFKGKVVGCAEFGWWLIEVMPPDNERPYIVATEGYLEYTPRVKG